MTASQAYRTNERKQTNSPRKTYGEARAQTTLPYVYLRISSAFVVPEPQQAAGHRTRNVRRIIGSPVTFSGAATIVCMAELRSRKMRSCTIVRVPPRRLSPPSTT